MDAFLSSVIDFIEGIASSVKAFFEPRLFLVGSIFVYAIAIIVFVAIELSGYNGKFRRGLAKANRFLSMSRVNERNISSFNQIMAKFPKSVKKGWNCYKQNGIGFPSEYITEFDCLRVPMVENAKKNYSTIYLLIAAVYELFSAGLMIWNAPAPNAIPSLCFSLMVAIVGYCVLTLIMNSMQTRLFKLFRRFDALIDEKIDIFEEKNALSCELEKK